jgi:hypothetical protein
MTLSSKSKLGKGSDLEQDTLSAGAGDFEQEPGNCSGVPVLLRLNTELPFPLGGVGEKAVARSDGDCIIAHAVGGDIVESSRDPNGTLGMGEEPKGVLLSKPKEYGRGDISGNWDKGENRTEESFSVASSIMRSTVRTTELEEAQVVSMLEFMLHWDEGVPWSPIWEGVTGNISQTDWRALVNGEPKNGPPSLFGVPQKLLLKLELFRSLPSFCADSVMNFFLADMFKLSFFWSRAAELNCVKEPLKLRLRFKLPLVTLFSPW